MPTCMSAVPRTTAPSGLVASRRALSKVSTAARNRPRVSRMSACAIEQPKKSPMCPIRSKCTRHSAYDVSAVSRSPEPQAASPVRAEAAPRDRWSSSSARSSARCAKPTAPSTSPDISARPARWTATSAGRRRNASWSTTTIPSAGSSSHRWASSSSDVDAVHGPGGQARATQARCRARAGPGAPRSGSISSQARSVGSRRSLRITGISSSTRSAAAAKSSPAMACRIASTRSPFDLVPVTGQPMQLRRPAGLLVEQSCLQHVGEEVVVAVPLSPVVERDQEQVPLVEVLQHGPARRPAR